MTEFQKVTHTEVQELSELASSIVREHYDPILGEEQNRYMIQMFQSPSAITEQLDKGWQYYYLLWNGQKAGFTAFYPKQGRLYISKLYVHKDFRRKHIAADTVQFLAGQARQMELPSLFLNVNKYNDGSIAAYERMGFVKVRAEKNPIGSGYFMDDFVMEKEV